MPASAKIDIKQKSFSHFIIQVFHGLYFLAKVLACYGTLDFRVSLNFIGSMTKIKWIQYKTILICALGYFVDIYDLLLFGIVRVPSLKTLGIQDSDMLKNGVYLINMQMTGLLFGGVLWGVLGDKRGRKSVLFGSILIYSVANIANAFVTNVEAYAWLRLIAGIGLAGELGAAITLVSEIMPKELRGIGTSVVAGVGILGAVAASLIGDSFSWQTAYIIGGVMGLGLLALRSGLLDSEMFAETEKAEVSRGSFLKLFAQFDSFKKYLSCILIGIPIWFVIGIMITFAPELGKAIAVVGDLSASKAIMWTYVGLSIGDVGSGLVSQWMKSRKKVVGWFLGLTYAIVLFCLFSSGMTPNEFYFMCVVLGVGVGYWAIFVTIAAEQFGTNIRATVTTTVPNFVRGSVIILTLSFKALKEVVGMTSSILYVGTACFVFAALALWFLQETYSKDLNYHDQL